MKILFDMKCFLLSFYSWVKSMFILLFIKKKKHTHTSSNGLEMRQTFYPETQKNSFTH